MCAFARPSGSGAFARGRRRALLCILIVWLFVFEGLASADPPLHRLVVVADIHGDVENCREVLRMAQLVDDSGHWSSGRDILVQLGDIVDRGPHGAEILDYLQSLKREAVAAGGEVIQLLGNHEVFGLRGDTRFVAEEALSSFGGRPTYVDAWSPTGPYGAIISQLEAAVVRHQTLLVHAGLLPTVLHAAGSLDGLNQKVRDAIQRRDWDSNMWLGIDGPTWTRQQVHGALAGDCRSVYETLRMLTDHEVRQGRPPVERMIVGHSIQPNGLVPVLCNGSFLALDVAMSQYMLGGGWLAFVEVRRAMDGRLTPFIRYPPERDRKHPLTLPKRPTRLSYKQRVRNTVTSDTARSSSLIAAPLLLLLIVSWRYCPYRVKARLRSCWRRRRVESSHADSREL